MPSEIKFWDRKSSSYQIEKVYGSRAIELAYGSRPGKFFTQHFLTNPLISRLYGVSQSTPSSAKKIPEFIRQYDIDMSEYESGPFRSFNDFFIRQFKEGKRTTATELSAFAEARYLAYESVSDERSLYIKGTAYNLTQLLGSETLAHEFQDASIWIAGLCPVDYHRFHYPLDCTVTSSNRIPGRLHSVNPVAMKEIPNLIQDNERHLSILESPSGAKLAYIEVGALMVGKIVQTNCETGKSCKNGQEKGYFLFGASTVVLLAQKGSFIPSKDILEQSKKGFETRVLLGENIGTNVNTPSHTR